MPAAVHPGQQAFPPLSAQQQQQVPMGDASQAQGQHPQADSMSVILCTAGCEWNAMTRDMVARMVEGGRWMVDVRPFQGPV
jgi:hypothetical protein